MNFTHLWVVVFLLKMHGSHLHNFFPLKTGLMLHEVELQGCDDCIVGKSPKLLTEEPVLVETWAETYNSSIRHTPLEVPRLS